MLGAWDLFDIWKLRFENLIQLDGSYGEGGGQILRTALALSSVLGVPFEIYNIRKGRKNPGLRPQHLTGVRAAARIAQAQVQGDELGSERLRFEPSGIRGGGYEFDVAQERGSAGAVTLVVQTILPILSYAQTPSRVTIRGGTHVPFSPPFDYLARVLLPMIGTLGYSARARIERYGFYPVGGGEIVLEVEPARIEPTLKFEALHRGGLEALHLSCGVGRLSLKICERERDRILKHCQTLGVEPQVELREVRSLSPGNYLFLLGRWESGVPTGFSALGKPGKPAEQVADELWLRLKEYLDSGAVCDPHLADQLLCFLALGRIEGRFLAHSSRHLLTNAWVIQKFMRELRIEITEGRVEIGGMYCAKR